MRKETTMTAKTKTILTYAAVIGIVTLGAWPFIWVVMPSPIKR